MIADKPEKSKAWQSFMNQMTRRLIGKHAPGESTNPLAFLYHEHILGQGLERFLPRKASLETRGKSF